MKDYMESKKSNYETLTEEKLKEVIEDLYYANPVSPAGMVIYGGKGFAKLWEKALLNAVKPRDPKTGRYIKKTIYKWPLINDIE